MIKPILLYGSEIGGQQSNCLKYEIVHTKFCKNVLGISYSSDNNIVRAELGRFPLQIQVYKNRISYWFKVMQMSPSRIPSKCYRFLKRLADTGIDCNWVSKVRDILNSHGFGFVWLNQGVDNQINFLKVFEQRCKDMYYQDCRSSTSSFYQRVYVNVKIDFDMEKYIDHISLFKHRRCVTLIRTGSHNLNINGWYPDSIDGTCRMCDLDEIEDELHFCLICPAYIQPRTNLIPSHYWQDPSSLKLFALLTDHHASVNFAKYLYVAFNIRKSSAIIL